MRLAVPSARSLHLLGVGGGLKRGKRRSAHAETEECAAL